MWCDQCAVGSVTDSTQESIGDNIVLSRDVLYIGCELGYKVEIIKLLQWAFILLLLEGVGNGLVVGEDGEVAHFWHVMEVF